MKAYRWDDKRNNRSIVWLELDSVEDDHCGGYNLVDGEPELTPAEARVLAAELLAAADDIERNP